MTGRDLKEIRLGMRMSLREFALLLGMSYGLIAHWEKGRRQLPEADAIHIKSRLKEYAEQQIGFFHDMILVHRL
jgi:transcriptional regulator with XRE-family HTH domain